jgi:hypothetical protein
MFYSNNEDNSISLKQIICLLWILTRWFVNVHLKFLIGICLLQLVLFLWMTILGIPIGIRIYKWGKNTLEPVVNKWLNTDLLDMIIEAEL